MMSRAEVTCELLLRVSAVYKHVFITFKFEEDPSVGKNIAQLGDFAVALSRGEVDAESVDKVINNLDKLGVLPWDKTKVFTRDLTQCLKAFAGFLQGTQDIPRGYAAYPQGVHRISPRGMQDILRGYTGYP